MGREKNYIKISICQILSAFFDVTGPTAEELWKIREAISKAKSLEEVERLNKLLQSGQVPGKKATEGQ